jgi:hypothetical protein
MRGAPLRLLPPRGRRGAVALLALGWAVAASAGEAPRIGVGQPAGFDTVLQAQEAVADVYVGGIAVGQARVRYRPGRITLLDADAVVAMLPDLLQPALVRQALATTDLDSHAGLVCAEEDTGVPACGTLRPEIAGVIFDERRFRLDVFVADRLRAIHPVAPRAYLAPPTAGLSLVDQIGGSIAGTGGRTNYGILNRAILARGEARIRNNLFWSSRFGLSVDTLVAEVDRPGVRYSAGAMWVPGIELIGRRRLVGAGIQSQIDTRLDRTVIAGTPLVVALAARARVEILRDGRLLSSRTYDPGNQTLDTTTLPDGAYEVVLHIQEAGGGTRDERRFFTRNAAIAAIGDPIFFGYAGLLGEDRRRAPLATTRTPLYVGGVARRFSPRLALDATVMGTDRTALLELGGYWLSRAAQLRVAGLASVRGDAGVFVQANSSGAARLNFTLDARRIWSRGDRPLIPFGGTATSGYDIVSIDRTAQLSAGSFAQVNGSISYNLSPGQVGLTASYRHDPRAGRSYAIGPSVYWPLVERAGVQVVLRGDATWSNHGRTALIGLAFQRLRARSTLSATAGARSTSGSGSGSGTAVVGSIGGSWQRDDVLGGDASLAGGLEREVDGTLARVRADVNAARGSLYADIAQPIAGDNGATQYSLNFQSTAAVTAGGIALHGREQQDSAIEVAVDGVARGTPFEVLVDNAPRGTMRAGTPLSLPVPAYRHYTVRLRSTGDEILQFDGGAKQVSVYPGNVSRLRWAAHRVVALFGRLVWPDGGAVADAAIHGSGAIAATDANGWFQIETTGDAVLEVQAPDGRSCRVAIAARPTPQGYAALGTLTCQHLPDTRLMASNSR